MRVFLASIPLPGATIVIVGEGSAAAAKARLFDGSGAEVRWFAGPAAQAEDAIARWPAEMDLDAARLVFIAVADPDLRDRVAAWGRARGAQVNVVDQPALSDFHTPALIDRDGVVVGIATGGVAPVLAREVRSRVEAALPAGLDRLARLAEGLRQTVIATLPDFTARRRFWEAAFRGPARDLAVEGRTADARRHMLRLLNTDAAPPGVVHLVGAGPGDPELLTLKALRALQDADVIVHDRLVPTAILDRARRDAHRIYVGKQRNDHSVPQAEIADLLIAEARQGHRVVRLKGGDPFVFGRGGEELEAVRAAGVDVVVVPGITAALGCAAAAGIPLTYRDQAQAVTFVTAETRPGGVEADWSALSAPNHTLAVYMGVSGARTVQDRLISGGRDPRTPVAIIENGSRPDQRTFTGRLEDLAELVRREAVASPALLVVGEVAAWAEAVGSRHSEEAAA
ncbi:siroheme synthase CysG [Brevundimonas sp.]|uniref:siroheme synthase CysG n=1 Tax=Brevundimonas sp. TaxID=1871086 RepID=UPI003D0D9B39